MLCVAIDIDGVIVDIEKYILEKGVSYYQREPKSKTGFVVSDFFDVPKDKEMEFWNHHYVDYISHASVFAHVGAVTKRLHERGVRVILVSARKYREGRGFASSEVYWKTMKEHLRSKGVYFDEIYSEDRPKVKAVAKYGIDIFIEDDPFNIEALKDIVHVLIKDASYNHSLQLVNTERFTSWLQVEDMIGKWEESQTKK